MSRKPSLEPDDRRRAWDAAYRERHREKRRAYDRERMRRIRAQERSEGAA